MPWQPGCDTGERPAVRAKPDIAKVAPQTRGRRPKGFLQAKRAELRTVRARAFAVHEEGLAFHVFKT